MILRGIANRALADRRTHRRLEVLYGISALLSLTLLTWLQDPSGQKSMVMRWTWLLALLAFPFFMITYDMAFMSRSIPVSVLSRRSVTLPLLVAVVVSLVLAVVWKVVFHQGFSLHACLAFAFINAVHLFHWHMWLCKS